LLVVLFSYTFTLEVMGRPKGEGRTMVGVPDGCLAEVRALIAAYRGKGVVKAAPKPRVTRISGPTIVVSAALANEEPLHPPNPFAGVAAPRMKACDCGYNPAKDRGHGFYCASKETADG
jgi:hypothetical protein